MDQEIHYLLPFHLPKQEPYVPVYQTGDSLQADSLSYSLPWLVTSFVPDFRTQRPDAGDFITGRHFDWITLILTGCFILVAAAKYNFPKRLAQLLKASLIPRATNQLYRQGNPFQEQISYLLGFIYLLTSSLFIFLIIDKQGWLPPVNYRIEYLYAGIFAGNSFYWLCKALLIRMLAHIFKTYEATRGYLLNNLVFNMTLGVFLLIVLPFIVYTGSEVFLHITLILVSIILIYKVLRSVLVGLSITYFPVFYLLLFICMIELAPLLILAKLFMSYS